MPILSTRLGRAATSSRPLAITGRENNWLCPDAPETCTFPYNRPRMPRVSRHFHLIGSVSSGRWPDDSSRKQNTRDVLTISNVLFMQRGRGAVSLVRKKKNVSDLPGRLESCRCCRDDFSFLKLLSTGLWTIFVFSIKKIKIQKGLLKISGVDESKLIIILRLKHFHYYVTEISHLKEK